MLIVADTVKAVTVVTNVSKLTKGEHMTDKEIAEAAAKVRIGIGRVSDRELAYFHQAIFEQRLDSVESHIRRIANAYDPEVPF